MQGKSVIFICFSLLCYPLEGGDEGKEKSHSACSSMSCLKVRSMRSVKNETERKWDREREWTDFCVSNGNEGSLWGLLLMSKERHRSLKQLQFEREIQVILLREKNIIIWPTERLRQEFKWEFSRTTCSFGVSCWLLIPLLFLLSSCLFFGIFSFSFLLLSSVSWRPSSPAAQYWSRYESIPRITNDKETRESLSLFLFCLPVLLWIHFPRREKRDLLLTESLVSSFFSVDVVATE